MTQATSIPNNFKTGLIFIHSITNVAGDKYGCVAGTVYGIAKIIPIVQIDALPATTFISRSGAWSDVTVTPSQGSSIDVIYIGY